MKIDFVRMVLACWLSGHSILLVAQPRLSVPENSNPGWTLKWTAEAGSSYTVQTRDSLNPGVWLTAPHSAPWPITSNNWIESRSASNQRFYRVLAVQPAQRGKILSSTQIASYSVFELGFLFQLGQVPITPLQGIVAHKIVYETVDPWGNRTQASGVVVIPQSSSKPLPLASYQHGTLAKRSEAPSANALGERVLGYAFASTGYIGVLPDYLGLGDSSGIQPYHHARSEAASCVDMLRAAKAFCQSKGISLNGQLFLTGYSHGGHVTMSLLRELESYHSDEFSVTAAAPMAGAYDLSGVTFDDVLSQRAYPNPFNLLLLLAMVQDVYRVAPSLGDLFVAPYDKSVPPLVDGNHSGDDLNVILPTQPTKILKPELMAAMASDPNHPVRLVLRENDVYAWKPKSPVRMYHCAGDQDVLKANSEVALRYFQSQGASNVQLLDLNPSASHGDCSEPSLVAAKLWFDSLKN